MPEVNKQPKKAQEWVSKPGDETRLFSPFAHVKEDAGARAVASCLEV